MVRSFKSLRSWKWFCFIKYRKRNFVDYNSSGHWKRIEKYKTFVPASHSYFYLKILKAFLLSPKLQPTYYHKFRCVIHRVSKTVRVKGILNSLYRRIIITLLSSMVLTNSIFTFTSWTELTFQLLKVLYSYLFRCIY